MNAGNPAPASLSRVGPSHRLGVPLPAGACRSWRQPPVAPLRPAILSIALLAGIAGCAADPHRYREYVAYQLSHSEATALVRIRSVRPVEELRDATTGRVGYKRFEVAAEVLETFRGRLPPGILIHVTQEQPSDPPGSGEFIVSVDDAGPYFVLSDDAVLWVAATPDLVRLARRNR